MNTEFESVELQVEPQPNLTVTKAKNPDNEAVGAADKPNRNLSIQVSKSLEGTEVDANEHSSC